jgi:hypothetical protein
MIENLRCSGVAFKDINQANADTRQAQGRFGIQQIFFYNMPKPHQTLLGNALFLHANRAGVATRAGNARDPLSVATSSTTCHQRNHLSWPVWAALPRSWICSVSSGKTTFQGVVKSRISAISFFLVLAYRLNEGGVHVTLKRSAISKSGWDTRIPLWRFLGFQPIEARLLRQGGTISGLTRRSPLASSVANAPKPLRDTAADMDGRGA